MNWRDLEEFPIKENEVRPSKVEYLYEDGRTGRVIIWGNESTAHMKIDPVCLEGLKPIKWRAV